jgi:hypothetical protein
MANTNIAFGFRPVQDRTGNPWTGKCQSVIIAAADTAAIFPGSMLKLTGDQLKKGDTNYQVATLANPADTQLIGAAVGVQTQTVESLQYLGYRPAGARAAGEDVIVQVPQDRDVIYAVQENSVGGGGPNGSIPSNSAGANIDFVAGTNNTPARRSGQLLDSATVNTTAALPLRLIKYDNDPTNEAGALAVWLVTLNQDHYSNTTGI